MSQITVSDYEQRVLRLLELIDARRIMLKRHRDTVEPSQLMIDEYTDLLRRHVNELNTLMQKHGLSVQLTHDMAAWLLSWQKTMLFTAIYLKVSKGYIGFVEELPGANTQGKTLKETQINLKPFS